MTNSQPEDLTTRVATIEEQLNHIIDELDLIGTIQNGVRLEVRATSQSTARLERTVRQLAEISARTQAVVVRQQETINQQQENIERILTYLENPNRGDTMPN
ncbi:MAG: hypothetical protein HC836_15020 [Richelia sp. RM2_1_2]|nr:hypothetical protein [Richelia sp. SM2_1_7]NJM17839.1 hypothetical protein [Richelia sp. SM1_7_0]NJN09503.1 hypothetical protein [Richelia sp. RM1_1_1]NJO27222.1 hypothetical protein [Richelia sp. SL_2_1]NJO59559.1 hypothetical protein [Richelia sp. RM2_1_2]NJS16473.1 hypothetical protein [Nostocaceae cyanobacterium CSU_2_110]